MNETKIAAIIAVAASLFVLAILAGLALYTRHTATTCAMLCNGSVYSHDEGRGCVCGPVMNLEKKGTK